MNVEAKKIAKQRAHLPLMTSIEHEPDEDEKQHEEHETDDDQVDESWRVHTNSRPPLKVTVVSSSRRFIKLLLSSRLVLYPFHSLIELIIRILLEAKKKDLR